MGWEAWEVVKIKNVRNGVEMFTISHPYFAGPGGMDMASMMAGMGGDKPDMDDLDGDSDDEDLPDLE